MGLATVLIHPDILERVREQIMIVKAYEFGDGMLYCMLEDERFIDTNPVPIFELFFDKDGHIRFKREADT